MSFDVLLTVATPQKLRNGVLLALLSLVLPFASGCNTTNGYMNNQLGTSFYKQGNYTQARDEFQRAVANDPWNADYIHNLATAQKRQGDQVGAEHTYRHALHVDPGHQPSYHGLALLLKEQGRTNEALDMLYTWTESQPYSAEPFIETAWLKREIGDMAGSEQLLLSALRASPNDPVATAQLGQLYEDTHQPDRAIAMYRRSLYTQWYQPQVQSRLAALQRGVGHSGGVAGGPATAWGAPVYGSPGMAYGPPAPVYTATPGWPGNAMATLPGQSVPASPGYVPAPGHLSSPGDAISSASPPHMVSRLPPQASPPLAQQPLSRGMATGDADPAHPSEGPEFPSDLPVVQPH